MRTPKEYTDNLKNGIITTAMLNDCLYSMNKRAKNYRDAKQQNYIPKYRASAEEKEQAYYRKKEILLSLVKPSCIHKEMIGYETVRVYDYEKKFAEKYIKALLFNEIVHTNSYIDYYSGTQVFFFDRANLSAPKYLYFLYYEIGTMSYHAPIEENDIEKYKAKHHIDVQEIGRLITEGDNYKELISVQFVDNVINALHSGNARYKETEPIIRQTYENERIERDAMAVPPGEAINNIKSLLEDEVRIVAEERVPELSEEQILITADKFYLYQKKKKKSEVYKPPYVKTTVHSPHIRYMFDDELLKDLRGIASRDQFSLHDLAEVACRRVPVKTINELATYVAYRNAARKLQQIALKDYQTDNTHRISLNEIIAKKRATE